MYADGTSDRRLQDKRVVSQALDNEAECIICMDQLNETEIVELPCDKKHIMHFKCIEKWL